VEDLEDQQQQMLRHKFGALFLSLFAIEMSLCKCSRKRERKNA
jgi:hypothetical protein